MKVWRPLLGLAAVFATGPLASAADRPPKSAPDSARGAVVPWVTYEAEQSTTTGTTLGPDYTGHTAAREASGRRCVRLAATGQFLEFTANDDAQGMVVRYSVPDSPDGRGIDATLSLSINGKPRQKLAMTSRYCYLYGDYPFNNQPSSGNPRHFWDELHVMPGAIHRGDVVRLQKDADDAASEYLIDLVDLEQVPPVIESPANADSITSFGAKPDGRSDARPAFLAAIADAKAHHKIVWIPPGQFLVKGALEVSDVTVRGAGMWYSTLIGADDYTPTNRVAIDGNGSNVTLSDFAIVGNLNYRNDSEPNDGVGGSFGTGSSIHNIWVEHTKTGAWLVNSDGLLVDGCRFRDTIADGINLCVGMKSTTVRNCTARGTGDDCFAMWPATYIKSKYTHGGNRFVHCTAQLPFLAQAFSIYGGDANAVEDSVAVDIPYGAGLFASTTFPTEFGFRGMTNYRRVDITRAGDRDGAVGTFDNLIDLVGVHFEDIQVIDSVTDGIKFTSINGRALREATFDRIRIAGAGIAGAGYGIAESHGAVGSATLNQVTVAGAKTAGCQKGAPGFHLIQGAGNSGLEESAQATAENSASRRAAVAP